VKEPEATATKGTVTDQTPAGATQAPKSSVVTITVSTGPEQVTVPSVVGMTQADAVAAIRALGLIESVQTLSGSLPADIGKVKVQDPLAVPKTKVNKGTTITIWVGGP
jgi:serine/threonine-protein kinase